ncbi:MAG: DoxX family protein [Chloroflexi bacterium]|nr:DoxX family protein [Chloroflexota bacterium]
MAARGERDSRLLENPRWLTLLFSSTEFAWVWLAVRLYLGVQWVNSGWHKLFEDAWMDGTAVQGFWERIVAIPEQGRPAISYDWYRSFIQFMLDHEWYTWFGPLVAVGETMVGIALLAGLFTGIAAFFGALMNWNFMLSGTASVNPILGIMGIAVLAAWKTAGWWGLDRWVLPLVGAPWQRGTLFGGGLPVLPGQQRYSLAREIEQWVRIAIGGAMLASALAYMTGWAQVLVVLAALAVLATTGFGKLYITSYTSRPAATEDMTSQGYGAG